MRADTLSVAFDLDFALDFEIYLDADVKINSKSILACHVRTPNPLN